MILFDLNFKNAKLKTKRGNMKVVSALEAAKLIKSNTTVGVSGSGGSGSPEAVLLALKNRFLKTKQPKNLTVTSGISPGNLTYDDVGMNCFACDGMVGKAICAHLGMGKKFGVAVGENKFPAFAIPLGIYTHLLRATAAKKPGVLSQIGLNTFVDPRLEGAAANQKAKAEKPILELTHIGNKEYLFYKSYPINVAIIKATYADTKGNISLEWEPIIGEQFLLAAAAHNSGGIVIVQVEKIVEYGSLKAKDVIIPSVLVDYVVVAKPSKALGEYNIPVHTPSLVGKTKIELQQLAPMPLNERKICARRAIYEIKKGSLINFGIGFPEAVASVLNEEGCISSVTSSIETGITGGVAQSGVTFGVAFNADSIISDASMFDLYDGGVLDMAVLGMAEVDQFGNVNVSKFGKRVTGPGGFINITQTTKKILFLGTFTSSGLQTKTTAKGLNIALEGKIKKFVKNVGQITFSAKNAIENGQDVSYITERAVFKLTKKGVELTEIAPNVDLQKDVLAQMEFKPIISKNLKIMDKKIFKTAKMNFKLK